MTEFFGSWIGDANLDLEFNSSDMVQVFVRGKYETGEAATFAEGDWNRDGVFDSTDFVNTFALGNYQGGELPMNALAVDSVFGEDN